MWPEQPDDPAPDGRDEREDQRAATERYEGRDRGVWGERRRDEV